MYGVTLTKVAGWPRSNLWVLLNQYFGNFSGQMPELHPQKRVQRCAPIGPLDRLDQRFCATLVSRIYHTLTRGHFVFFLDVLVHTIVIFCMQELQANV